jgi:SecD/SecF fusion protein
MIPLFIMTGEALRQFTLPLMVGVIAGALSSIVVCSPLYFEFNKLSRKSRYAKSMKGKKKTEKRKK